MPASKTGPSKARARPTRPKSQMERRLEEVLRLMLRQAYSPIRARELARKWKVDESVVRRVAAEASRFIKFHVDADLGEIRETILSSLQFIGQEAVSRRNYVAGLKALELQAKIYGLFAVPEQTVNHRFEPLTDEEAERRRDELLSDLGREARTQ